MAGYMKNGSGVRITAPKDGKQGRELASAIGLLADVEVLVGVPEETTDHRNEDGQTYITNAALAAIHDQGAPEAHIPARPFMKLGIEAVRDKITLGLRKAATVAMKTGDAGAIEASLHAVGLTAQLSIQNTIQQGIPPPLAESTLRERARKRKGRVGPGLELLSRSKGHAPSTDYVKPLIDTADMLKSITYVIRSRKKRSP